MPAITCALSAICGTHLGLTKLVTSISRQPAACKRCTSSILTSEPTGMDSFCSPSRGPTSTRVTRVGFMVRSLYRDGLVLLGVVGSAAPQHTALRHERRPAAAHRQPHPPAAAARAGPGHRR